MYRKQNNEYIKQSGTFDFKCFDQLINKIKNPVIHVEMRTLIDILNHISKNNNMRFDSTIIVGVLLGKDMQEVIKEIVNNYYRFDLINKEYNMFGLKIPIIIYEDNYNDCQNPMIVENGDDENDFGVFFVSNW